VHAIFRHCGTLPMAAPIAGFGGRVIVALRDQQRRMAERGWTSHVTKCQPLLGNLSAGGGDRCQDLSRECRLVLNLIASAHPRTSSQTLFHFPYKGGNRPQDVSRLERNRGPGWRERSQANGVSVCVPQR